MNEETARSIMDIIDGPPTVDKVQSIKEVVQQYLPKSKWNVYAYSTPLNEFVHNKTICLDECDTEMEAKELVIGYREDKLLNRVGQEKWFHYYREENA